MVILVVDKSVVAINNVTVVTKYVTNIFPKEVNFMNQVTCIVKHDRGNPHERIKSLGGINGNGGRWDLTENEVIKQIKTGNYSFYVVVNGRRVNVIIAIHEGREYLKTTADGYAPNNLLNLPGCRV